MAIHHSLRRFLPILLSASLLAAASPARAVTFTVTNANPSGQGSLAQAISDANLTGDPDTINFNIISLSPVLTIGGVLPAITQPLTIDGYSQSGTFKNTAVDDSNNAVIRIELDASAVPLAGAAIKILNGPTIIKGIAIKNIPLKTIGIDIGAEGDTSSIKGCFIGTGAGGTDDFSQGIGIVVRGTANLGGSGVGDRNLISGHAGAGIQLRGLGMSMTNNFVGLDRNGDATLGNGTGVLVTSSTFISSIGGSSAETRNVMAGNDGPGIRILAAATGAVSIGANHFFDNGGLGIELGTDGVTPNDEGDVDTGPNGLQNHPELTFALVNPGNLHLEGALDSEPGQYRINVYRNSSVDDSGFGEGEEFLDTFELEIPDGETRISFSADVPLGLLQNGTSFITTTAERMSTGATSEFSEAIRTTAGGQELVVTNTNDSGAGSFRAAVVAANLSGQRATIVFDIPGDAPHTIALLTGMAITVPIIVDGYSQPGSEKNTLHLGTNAIPGVFFDGSGASSGTKILLEVDGSESLIRGIGIHDSPGAALVIGSGALQADTDVQGCFFGVDPTGTNDLGNGASGIVTGEGTLSLLIGGPLPEHRNLISGNGGSGILDRGKGTAILGNIIGGDATGLGNLGNDRHGIDEGGSKTTIGGDDPALGNVIRGNGLSGIAVFAQLVDIRGNSISDNGRLGIDLGPPELADFEVTENDADDADNGPNGLQNYPELVTESILPGSAKFEAFLDVPSNVVNGTFRLRFFDNETCDESGHGEGGVFLGAVDVVLSGDDEEFSVELPVTLGETHIITVTASVAGNTSEFSECFGTFDPPSACGDANGDAAVTAGDGQLALKTAVGSAECDLCRCDVNLSATITTSDALLMLRAGVGQQVELECPACD